MKKLLIYSLFAVSFLGSGPVECGVRSWFKSKMADRKAKNKQEDLDNLSDQITKTRSYLKFQSNAVEIALRTRNEKEQKYQARVKKNASGKKADIRDRLRKQSERHQLVPLSDVYKAWHRCLRILDINRDDYAKDTNAKGGDKFRIIVRKKGSLQLIERIRTIKGLYDLHKELVEDFSADEPAIKALWLQIKNLESQVEKEAKALFNYMTKSMGVNKDKLASDPKDTLRQIKLLERTAAEASSEIRSFWKKFKKSYNIQSALISAEEKDKAAAYSTPLSESYSGIPTDVIYEETIERKKYCSSRKNVFTHLAEKFFSKPSQAPYITYLQDRIDEVYEQFVHAGFTIIAARVYIENCNKSITKTILRVVKKMQKAVDRADDTFKVRSSVKFKHDQDKNVLKKIKQYIGFNISSEGKVTATQSSKTTRKDGQSTIFPKANTNKLKSYLVNFSSQRDSIVTSIKKYEREFDRKRGKKLIEFCKENPFFVRDAKASKALNEDLYQPWTVLQMIKQCIQGNNFDWNSNLAELSFKKELENISNTKDDELFADLMRKQKEISADLDSLSKTETDALKAEDEKVEAEVLRLDKEKARDYLAKGAFRWHRVISDFKVGQTKRREFDFHLNTSWNPTKWRLSRETKSYGKKGEVNQFEEFGSHLILALILNTQVTPEQKKTLKKYHLEDKQKELAKCLATELIDKEVILLEPKNEIPKQDFDSALQTITEKFSHRYSIVYIKEEYDELDAACVTVSKALGFPYGEKTDLPEDSPYQLYTAAEKTVTQRAKNILKLAELLGISPQKTGDKTTREALIESKEKLKKLVPEIADTEIDAIEEQVEKVLENFETPPILQPLSLDDTVNAVQAWMNSATEFQKAVEFYATALDAYCKIKLHPEIKEAVKELSHLESKNMDELAARYTSITLSLDAEKSLEINRPEQWEETKRLIKNMGPISNLSSKVDALPERLKAQISAPLQKFLQGDELAVLGGGTSIDTQIQTIESTGRNIAQMVSAYYIAQMHYQFAQWADLTLYEQATGPQNDQKWLALINNNTNLFTPDEQNVVEAVAISDEPAFLNALTTLKSKLSAFKKKALLPYISEDIKELTPASASDISTFVRNYAKLKNWKDTTEKGRTDRIKTDSNVLEAYRQALIALVTKIKVGREQGTEGAQANADLSQTKLNDRNNWLSTPPQDLFKTSGTYKSLGLIIEQTIQSNSLSKAAIDTVNTTLAHYKQTPVDTLVVANGFKSQLMSATEEVNNIASKIKNPKAQQRWRTAAEAVSATGALTAAGSAAARRDPEIMTLSPVAEPAPAVAMLGDAPADTGETNTDEGEASLDGVRVDLAAQVAAGVVAGSTAIHQGENSEPEIQDTQTSADRLEQGSASAAAAPTPVPKTPPAPPRRGLPNPSLNEPAVASDAETPKQPENIRGQVKAEFEKLVAAIQKWALKRTDFENQNNNTEKIGALIGMKVGINGTEITEKNIKTQLFFGPAFKMAFDESVQSHLIAIITGYNNKSANSLSMNDVDELKEITANIEDMTQNISLTS